MSSSRWRPWIWMFVLLACVSSGCGGNASQKLTEVTGNVSYRGAPLTHGSVVLMHQSGQSVRADIQADGTFTAQALPGVTRVSITSREPDQENPAGRPQFIPGKSLIPERYSDLKSSGLSHDVAMGGDVLNLELTDSSKR